MDPAYPPSRELDNTYDPTTAIEMSDLLEVTIAAENVATENVTAEDIAAKDWGTTLKKPLENNLFRLLLALFIFGVVFFFLFDLVTTDVVSNHSSFLQYVCVVTTIIIDIFALWDLAKISRRLIAKPSKRFFFGLLWVVFLAVQLVYTSVEKKTKNPVYWLAVIGLILDDMVIFERVSIHCNFSLAHQTFAFFGGLGFTALWVYFQYGKSEFRQYHHWLEAFPIWLMLSLAGVVAIKLICSCCDGPTLPFHYQKSDRSNRKSYRSGQSSSASASHGHGSSAGASSHRESHAGVSHDHGASASAPRGRDYSAGHSRGRDSSASAPRGRGSAAGPSHGHGSSAGAARGRGSSASAARGRGSSAGAARGRGSFTGASRGQGSSAGTS